jgi:hypothetical protein
MNQLLMDEQQRYGVASILASAATDAQFGDGRPIDATVLPY